MLNRYTSRVQVRSYNANPVIQFPDLTLIEGWDEILNGLEKFAIDGPIDLPWDEIQVILETRGFDDLYDVRIHLPDDEEISNILTSGQLSGHDFFGKIPTESRIRGIPKETSQTVCFGPGSGAFHDRVVIYLDRPKRISEAVAISKNKRLQRLYFYDWPISDRQRDSVIKDCHLYVDISNLQNPTGIKSADLGNLMQDISKDTFRTVPYFNNAIWGGNWAQNTLGMNVELLRTALGYEFIAPESAIQISNNRSEMEIPISVLLIFDAEGFVGPEVAKYFKGDFPIRFDYLDTLNGENLSIHVHPGSQQMQEIFGVLLGQEESYYLMVASVESVIYLGLDDKYTGPESVVAHPAEAGQLYLIPHGTPHGSGKGNVVLEVSTTPYMYSLRLHDWERLNSTGFPRPLNEKLALSAMESSNHRGQMSADLLPRPQTLDSGINFLLEILGSRLDWYFEVLRLKLDSGASYSLDLKESFFLVTVVAGDFIEANGKEYSYAETFIAPARQKQINFLNKSDVEVSLIIGRMKDGWVL